MKNRTYSSISGILDQQKLLFYLLYKSNQQDKYDSSEEEESQINLRETMQRVMSLSFNFLFNQIKLHTNVFGNIFQSVGLPAGFLSSTRVSDICMVMVL